MKPLTSSTALKRVFLSAVAASSLFGGSLAFGQVNGVGPSDPNPVSYTHLTLPTKA